MAPCVLGAKSIQAKLTYFDDLPPEGDHCTQEEMMMSRQPPGGSGGTRPSVAADSSAAEAPPADSGSGRPERP